MHVRRAPHEISGGESAGTIEDRAVARTAGAQRAWFARHFGTDPTYGALPKPPTASASPVGAATFVSATVDASVGTLDVEEVKVWWSNDDAFLFGSVVLDRQGDGTYAKLALFPTQPNTVWFVDVQYKKKGLLSTERFSMSTVPAMPAGFVPHIRNIKSCL